MNIDKKMLKKFCRAAANVIKLFTTVKARAFVPDKPFQPTRVKQGRLLAYPLKTLVLIWKGLPGTNALAYYEKS
jgi:hypothetical protein